MESAGPQLRSSAVCREPSRSRRTRSTPERIDEDLDSPTIYGAIDADSLLSASEKKLLLDMYRALIHSNGSVNKQSEQE